MTLAFRSPVTQPLHRRRADNVPRPPGDDFFVTQQYNDIDWYWSQRGIRRIHAAVDIGNWRCNYPIVAMAAGVATRISDNAQSLGAKSNALGIRIDHGIHDGKRVTTEYWHLNGWNVLSGVKVWAGQQIGILGSTGLGDVCHTHIEMKLDGVRIDPEPYMFGKTYGDDNDMSDALAAKTRAVIPYRARVAAGTSVRRDTRIADDTFVRTSGGGEFVVIGHATGEAHEGSDKWIVFLDKSDADGPGGIRTMHSAFVTPTGTAGEL